jgi:tRNA G10  N-methylase Trm11
MKYLFLLGRNVALSVAEVNAFFEKERFNFKISEPIDNALIVDVENPLKKNIIEKFGGVISIGQVLTSGNISKILQDLEKETLFYGTKNKLNYVLFNFDGKNYSEISDYLKQRFKREKLKATEKKLSTNIKLQEGGFASKVSSNLINEQYFIFQDNFGRIIETCDYDSIEKRDMKKPVRRESLSISPRLSKILINLSKVKERRTLLDPFCGVGTILQEALLQNIRVIGVDKNKQAIDDAETNLSWFNFKKSDYKLITHDSQKIKLNNIDAIATEPDLGELQKKFPSKEKAKEILSGFETLIINVINNLKGEVKGRIVFTCPLIKVGHDHLSCDFEKISSQTNTKIAKNFPISEFRKDSIVGRSILVLEKQTRNF